ncbi:MAG TPA: hypothetical protein VM901_08980 [Bdellovibrionota bacterium]|nr:hypothetical protein [Bdellovibrionota bacterium]
MADLFTGLSQSFQSNRLGHGLILSHRPNDGPRFAVGLRAWIQEVMCPTPGPSGKACRSCASCQALSPNAILEEIAHPDFLYLEPANETGYSVEQIREMSTAFALSLAMAKRRVVWISQAHKLSAGGGAPANALLKLLEEPRPNSLLVLSSSMPEALLPTIRSRCQHFRYRDPARALGRDRAPEIPTGWEPLLEWIQGGATPGRKWISPADDDGFWKDRQGAVLEMQSVRETLWLLSKEYWSKWDRHAALRVWDLFEHLELLLNEIKRYAQPQLGWLNFKMRASEAQLWKV